MIVNLSPNVADVVRADPVLAIIVESLRRDNQRGYLNLFRSRRTGPFDAVYYLDGERSSSTGRDLMDAIEHAITSNPAREAA